MFWCRHDAIIKWIWIYKWITTAIYSNKSHTLGAYGGHGAWPKNQELLIFSSTPKIIAGMIAAMTSDNSNPTGITNVINEKSLQNKWIPSVSLLRNCLVIIYLYPPVLHRIVQVDPVFVKMLEQLF